MKLKKIIAFLLSLLLCIAAYPDETTNLDSEDEVVEDSSSPKYQDTIGNMLLQAVSLMGISYRWGGNTPETGMDCSGFIRYIFKKSMGINLPRTASQMAKLGKRIDLEDLKPGDLLFFNTRRGANTHIGMYIGDNKFIQSPRTGQKIQITELSGYWSSHFNGAKRMVDESVNSEGETTLEEYQDVLNEALKTPVIHKNHTKKLKKHRNKKHKRIIKKIKKGKKNTKSRKRRKH